MYKTIVLHVDTTGALAVRLPLAARLARRHGAHLVGCAVADGAATERAALDAALLYFTAGAMGRKVASSATVHLEEPAIAALVRQSLCADLLVMGPDCRPAVTTALLDGMPDAVALDGACPVLMVPAGCTATSIGRRIVVGWDATPAAARAAHAALPLLRHAAHVWLAVPAARPAPPDFDLDPLPWLARHGVRCERTIAVTHDAGQSLLDLARDAGADAIVAGLAGRHHGHTHGHAPAMRRATRTLLDNPETCVLLAG